MISFLPGKIALLAEHAAGLSEAEVARAVGDDLRQRGFGEQIVVPELGHNAIVSFPAQSNGRAISSVQATIADPRNARRVAELVKQLNAQLQPAPPTRTPRDQPPTGIATDTPASALEAPARSPDLRLLVASPEWLSTGAPTAKGGGGPGGRPVPLAAAKRSVHAWRPSLFGDNRQSAVTGDGAGVIVAVLDTLQSHNVLDRAYETLVAGVPEGIEPHPILAGLWGASGRLRLHPAGNSHLLQDVDCSLRDHDYLMPDHGLFAAGLVHGAAPEAEIHLIEVLNPYGVGTMSSIAAGFRSVLELRVANPRAPIVVNLSLVMTLPQLDRAMLTYLTRTDPPLSAFTPEEIEQTSYLLQYLCNLLLDANIHVVAAAGNDADDEGIRDALDGKRPEARFPAAYDDIVGVGALAHDETAAVYSNRSDRPMRSGLAVWGGDKSATSEESDPSYGLLGLYLTNTFPGGQANVDGWARWSGTSFATPVIAGALAAILSRPSPPVDPVAELRNLSTRVEPEIGEIVPMTQVP